MMEVILNINKYNSHSGIRLNWEENYKIEVSDNHGEIVISANKEGLLSLANHLVNLAQYDIPVGSHIHLDQYNSLEKGLNDVIFQKTE
ncbi:MAG: hypothetical protein IJJ82_00515 [Clostridia bacterium]|nr:hypothetical protein [Clostridia bacterium]